MPLTIANHVNIYVVSIKSLSVVINSLLDRYVLRQYLRQQSIENRSIVNMKHQQVVVDYFQMLKTSLICLALAFSGWVLIR